MKDKLLEAAEQCQRWANASEDGVITEFCTETYRKAAEILREIANGIRE